MDSGDRRDKLQELIRQKNKNKHEYREDAFDDDYQNNGYAGGYGYSGRGGYDDEYEDDGFIVHESDEEGGGRRGQESNRRRHEVEGGRRELQGRHEQQGGHAGKRRKLEGESQAGVKEENIGSFFGPSQRVISKAVVEAEELRRRQEAVRRAQERAKLEARQAAAAAAAGGGGGRVQGNVRGSSNPSSNLNHAAARGLQQEQAAKANRVKQNRDFSAIFSMSRGAAGSSGGDGSGSLQAQKTGQLRGEEPRRSSRDGESPLPRQTPRSERERHPAAAAVQRTNGHGPPQPRQLAPSPAAAAVAASREPQGRGSGVRGEVGRRAEDGSRLQASVGGRGGSGGGREGGLRGEVKGDIAREGGGRGMSREVAGAADRINGMGAASASSGSGMAGRVSGGNALLDKTRLSAGGTGGVQRGASQGAQLRRNDLAGDRVDRSGDSNRQRAAGSLGDRRAPAVERGKPIVAVGGGFGAKMPTANGVPPRLQQQQQQQKQQPGSSQRNQAATPLSAAQGRGMAGSQRGLPNTNNLPASGSNRPSTASGNRFLSASGNRPSSAIGNRPSSAGGNRPSSAGGDRPSSVSGNRPLSSSGNRVASASAALQAKQAVRPSSAGGLHARNGAAKPNGVSNKATGRSVEMSKRRREEEYSDDDSFIESDGDEGYGRGGRGGRGGGGILGGSILSMFRRNYQENHRDPYDDSDDDKAMEVGWSTIRAEETRSARIAKEEDEREAELLAQEEARLLKKRKEKEKRMAK